MKHGSDWYKRGPAAYLGGVQGLTAKEHAVYSVTLDLIYAHGGSVNNDPSWISGWIKDMGSAAVRKTLISLQEKGKLILSKTEITEKRAKNEAKTKENLSETARESGSKGGKKTAENRASLNENNNLDAASAASKTVADKIRLDKKEEGKPSSTQEVENSEKSQGEDYLKFMDAHPKPIESKAGEDAFAALVASGVPASEIIAAANGYADTVKSWSGEAKVQQSDNFLDADRGKWRQFVPKAKAPPASKQDRMEFWAKSVIEGRYIAASTLTPDFIRSMIAAKLVTPEQLKARGIAA